MELTVYAFIKLQSRDRASIAKFEDRIATLPEVARCDLITGAHDYNSDRAPCQYGRLQPLSERCACRITEVFGIETSVVIGKVKDIYELPIDALPDE